MAPFPTHRGVQLVAGLVVIALAGVMAAMPTAAPPTPGIDAVTEWNAIAVQAGDTLERGTAQARELAMTHLAIHDALNAIRPVYEPYAGGVQAAADASPEAAVAAAAHDVLVATIPAQAPVLDQAFQRALARIPAGPPKEHGVAAGHAAARVIVGLCRDDGADRAADLRYAGKPGLGSWEPTPPHHLQALLPGWAKVRPLAIGNARSFLPPAPPELASAEYALQYAEVQALGAEHSRVRTPEQSEIALFWSGNVADGWNDIARQVVAARTHDGDRRNDLDLWASARLFALLNVAMSDGFIAGWTAKYHYGFWRPITAIRRGDADGNAATVPDRDWNSFLVTPEHPEYPSTHSVLSGASARVLQCALGGDRAEFRLTSAGNHPGITRHFHAFSQAAKEVAESRVYAGVHFRGANQAGLLQGQRIGQLLCDRYLRRLVRTGRG